VKCIRQVIVPEIFRPKRDTRGHVSLSRTTVIVVERGIDAGSIQSPAVYQEATHREVSAWEAPTLFDLNKPLTDEVLTVIGNLFHVALTYLLLENLLSRGSQPRGTGVTPSRFGIRLLPRLKAEGEGGRFPPIPTSKGTLTEAVNELGRGHMAELLLNLSSSHLFETCRVNISRGHRARLEVPQYLVALVAIEGIANVRQTLRVGGAQRGPKPP